jgi:alkylation response protein AidB-like acyl-CoA dehydrogenase
MVPRRTRGVVLHDDWDALGMRASSSQSVSFEEVQLPLSALRGGFPVGDVVEYIERNLAAGLFHAAAALGVAESAHSGVVAGLARRNGLDPHTQMLAAENVVDLSACRAVLSRAAALLDPAAPQRSELLVDLGEALRKQGEPQEEPASTRTQRGRETKEDLYREAERLGIRGRSRMTKDELRRAVERLRKPTV